MGFSGGGSNVLKPHTHDGTISQDGGALDMDGVTQASLTAGDTVYSDGSNLQRLAIGTPGQALTVSGSNLPSWASAGGATVELLHDATFSGHATDPLIVTYSASPAISYSDYSYLVVVINSTESPAPYGTNQLDVLFNGLTTGYYYDFNRLLGGSSTVNTGSNAAYIQVKGTDAQHLWQCVMFVGIPNYTSADEIVCTWLYSDENQFCDGGGYVSGTGNTLTEIKFQLQGGSSSRNGRIQVYGYTV